MSVPLLSPMAHRARDERGFMLIEVLVSAIILITASLAIFSTLTQADTAAGNQQSRLVAANLAQSELERIRALPVQDVQKYALDSATHTFVRSNITFHEEVTAKWVSDGGDEAQCTSNQGGLDYMRTTVSITWDGMGSAKPIALTSLYTPIAGSGGDTGSLSIHIVNRDGGPVSGILVKASGATTGPSQQGTTNVNGCVVFAFIPEDTYNISFDKEDWVDPDSNNKVTDAQKVTAGETNKLQYSYDSGGYTKATFYTKYSTLRTALTAQDYPTFPPHFQIWHAEQTAPGGFNVDTDTASCDPTKPSNTAANPCNWDGNAKGVPLYPFATPYTIYAGFCPANAIPAASATFVNIPRLSFQNAGAVYVPALQVTVYSGATILTPKVDGEVQVDSGCGIIKRSTGSDGLLGTGSLKDPGFPYSPAARVAVKTYDTASRTYKCSVTQTVANTDMAKGTLVNVFMTASGSHSPDSTGSCL